MARRFLVTIIFALFLLFISGIIDQSGFLRLRSRSAAAQINFPPALDLNGGGAGEDFNTFFVPGGGAVSIVDSDLTVSDADSPNLNFATITITNLKDAGAESLGVDPSGTAITIQSNSGGTLILNGPDTAANFQQVLRTITYQNSNPSPDMTTREVSFVVNDGEIDSNQPVSSIEFVDPGITISKGPENQTILMGEPAIFSIQVENTGNVPLKNIVVSDEETDACADSIPSLGTGAVYPISCEHPNVTADFSSLAYVEAQDDFGHMVTASDTANVQVAVPGISISKTPDDQTIVSGGSANFSIEVINTGDVTLNNIVVSDELAQDCEVSIPSLIPGASSGTISCFKPNVTADFTNTASVTADYDSGQVTASDTANVEVDVPGISISKTPDSQTIASGGSANFSIEVTNTGDVTLNNVVVTDVLAEDCEVTIASLSPGAMSPISCVKANVTADFTNTASVTADYGFGTVNDSDTAAVIVAKPKVEIDKKPGTQTILKGSAAQFTIDVKNSGNVPLNNIVVADPNTPACAGPVPALNPGQVHTISCAKTNVMENFTNIASVSAAHGYGTPVSANDSATVTVVNPGISITKTAVTPIVIKGDTAEFSIEVKNIGDVALKNIIVTDPKAPGCAKTIAALNPGETQPYSCSLNSVLATFTNEASVQAEDNFNHTVSDKDTAPVQVIDPEISIKKTAVTPTIAKGGTAEFTIEVQNTGDVTLYDVQIKDDRAPDCRRKVTTPLAPGDKRTISCEKTDVESDFINIAEVVATEKILNTIVTRTDDASVVVENPNISITKTPPSQTIARGGTAEFKIFVVNTSKFVDLVNVTVDDPRTPACSIKEPFDLDRGKTKIYECELAGVTQPFTNEITVKGENSNNGQEVSDTSIAVVKIRDMQVALTVDPPVLTNPGTAVDFYVMVTNGGSIPFRLQSLTVDQLGSLTDPNNANLENTNCGSAQDYEVEPGDPPFECSFSALSEEETGFYPYKLTVEAREEDSSLVKKDASASLTVVDSELLSVSLEAKPGAVPAPGATISEVIQIDNPAQNSTFTLDILIHSELGSLDNVGDCELGERIDPGKSYSCTITIPVTGAVGERIVHEVSAAGTTEDGKITGNIGRTTILLFDVASLNNWLPVISNPAPQSETYEENNDVACDAYPLYFPGTTYKFILDDGEDWYEFDVLRSGQVTIEVKNLKSPNATVGAYKNESCSQVSVNDEMIYDGGFSSERSLKFPAAPGHYFIRITAGDFSSGATYSLKVTID